MFSTVVTYSVLFLAGFLVARQNLVEAFLGFLRDVGSALQLWPVIGSLALLGLAFSACILYPILAIAEIESNRLPCNPFLDEQGERSSFRRQLQRRSSLGLDFLGLDRKFLARHIMAIEDAEAGSRRSAAAAVPMGTPSSVVAPSSYASPRLGPSAPGSLGRLGASPRLRPLATPSSGRPSL